MKKQSRIKKNIYIRIHCWYNLRRYQFFRDTVSCDVTHKS